MYICNYSFIHGSSSIINAVMSFYLFAVVYGTPTSVSNQVKIDLSGNTKLTKLNQGAFQSVLDYFIGKKDNFVGLKINLQGGKGFTHFHVVI